MTPLTLVYAGTEKWLGQDPAGGAAPAWGFSNPRLKLRSRASSLFTVDLRGADPGVAEAFPVIPFEAQITIYKDRVFAAGVFGGGTIIFQGRRTDLYGAAQPVNRGSSLRFEDAWYDLQHIIFQHFWKAYSGGVVTNVYFSRINLFQDISAGPANPWAHLTVDQQIAEIINYAHTQCAAPLQLGTVDPNWSLPFYGVKAVSCADALILCLRGVPDCVTYFDYTTAPPTLHFRQRLNLKSITLPYADGVSHQSSHIRPRPDLSPSQVVIQYQQTNTVTIGGVTNYLTVFPVDAYPALSTGRALRAIVVPIDLRGTSTTYVTGDLASQALDPTLNPFWVAHKPDLGGVTALTILDTTINGGGGHPHGITIVDSNTGANIDLTNIDGSGNPAYELLPQGSIASWMTLNNAGAVNIIGKDVTITAWVSYSKAELNAGILSQKVGQHQITCRLKLTNSPPAAGTYITIGKVDQGETAIFGLAQNIYLSMVGLQHDGEHVMLENNVGTLVDSGGITHPHMTCGVTLNLLGPGGFAGWTGMNAMIYEVDIDFFYGRTTVNFGPWKHLSAGELFDLLTAWQFRTVLENPQVRNTGQDSSGASVDLADAAAARENTTHSPPLDQIRTIAAPETGSNQTQIQFDATAAGSKGLNMQVVDVTGANVPGSGQVLARLLDCGGKKLYIQEVKICVVTAGVKSTKLARVLISDPY